MITRFLRFVPVLSLAACVSTAPSTSPRPQFTLPKVDPKTVKELEDNLRPIIVGAAKDALQAAVSAGVSAEVNALNNSNK